MATRCRSLAPALLAKPEVIEDSNGDELEEVAADTSDRCLQVEAPLPTWMGLLS
jgi:hypothetical protein